MVNIAQSEKALLAINFNDQLATARPIVAHSSIGSDTSIQHPHRLAPDARGFRCATGNVVPDGCYDLQRTIATVPTAETAEP